MTAMSANLSTAKTTLDSTKSACDQLIGAVGGGQLSGKGYSAVSSLFSEVIKPTVSDAKSEIDLVKADLESYTQADSLVSQYGDLNEDNLKAQLESVKAQRDATEQQIESNKTFANSLIAAPGASQMMLAKNAQLEIALAGYEDDIRELEDKLKALQEFNAQTAALFRDGLDNLRIATTDTVSLLKQLNGPISGIDILGAASVGSGTAASRKQIIDALKGGKLYVDKEGRVRLGKTFIYGPKGKDNKVTLYPKGEKFNKVTGTRIDQYGREFFDSRKAAAFGKAAATDTINDFRGWKNASTLGKWGKGAGAAGTLLTVGGNAATYFGDGDVSGTDVADFSVDTGVDLAGAAAAAGAGAVAGSFVLPPLGTVVGALVGLGVNALLNVEWNGEGTSATGATKNLIKGTYH